MVDEIRHDALALLAEGDVARHLAAVSLDIALADEVEQSAFVSAVYPRLPGA
jgi:hypothetical protein